MTIGEYIMHLGQSQQITPLQLVRCLKDIEGLNEAPNEQNLKQLEKVIKNK